MKKETKQGITLFAREAVVGMRYVTLSGYPVLILERVGKDVKVKNELSGRVVMVPETQVLKVFHKELVSKEAITMSKTSNTEKSSSETIKERVSALKGKRTIKRVYKGKEYVVSVFSEGFRLGKQVYTSLSAAAYAITKRDQIDGPRFFGLRKAA